MPKILNIFMMDIVMNGKTSGVMRFLDSLYGGLAGRADVKLHLIRISDGHPGLAFRRIAEDQYIIECDNISILNEPDFIWKNIMPLFKDKKNIILDLNTINLVYLAKFIQMRTGAKILSRLHCIPYIWRNVADAYPFRKTGCVSIKYIHDEFSCELDSYLKSDKLVCVAESGAEYVRKLNLGIKPLVINVGIDDYYEKREFLDKPECTAIFVGAPNKIKGFRFAMTALEKANAAGRKIKLILAGFATEEMQKEIIANHPNVEIFFPGTVPLDELCELYRRADIGLISSLAEQCSCATLEMLMTGLPIVCSGVPMVRGILRDDCALFVPWKFDKDEGFSLNTDAFARHLIKLADSADLRRKLSQAGRKLYLEKYTLNRLLDSCLKTWREMWP